MQRRDIKCVGLVWMKRNSKDYRRQRDTEGNGDSEVGQGTIQMRQAHAGLFDRTPVKHEHHNPKLEQMRDSLHGGRRFPEQRSAHVACLPKQPVYHTKLIPHLQKLRRRVDR